MCKLLRKRRNSKRSGNEVAALLLSLPLSSVVPVRWLWSGEVDVNPPRPSHLSVFPISSCPRGW